MKSLFKHKQSGLAMVEATIVLPIIVLLFLATAEFARMMMLLTTLNKAQQDGARYLSSHAFAGNTQSVALNTAAPNGNVYQARNLVVYGNIAGTGTPLLDGLTTNNIAVTEPAPQFVNLTTTYNFTPLYGSFLSFNVNYPLTSSVTMRAVR